MPFNIDVVYLLILVAVSFALLLLMRGLQKSAMQSLAEALYQKHDVGRYLEMLDSRRLRVVLRKSTLELLRLDGLLVLGDLEKVWQCCAALETLKLKPGEKLNWYQKALSVAVSHGDGDRARDYLDRIQLLITPEKDADLHKILDDAELLVGVYIDKNVDLIPLLETASEKQEGRQLGITHYRLAKLNHAKGDDDAVLRHLKEAQPLLEGTVWMSVIAGALKDRAVLEAQ